MMDLERLSQLYETAHDERKTPEQRQKAAELLAAIDADALIAEFLSLPANLWENDGKHPRRGQPKYENSDALANYVTGWLVWLPGESTETMLAREDRLKADKLGIVVRAHKLAEARARQTCSCDFTVLFGDQFYLSVHWCAGQPAHSPKEIKVLASV